MSKKPLAWWVVPGVITASLAALGALGTFMVKGAAYITLPERVEAGEQVNAKQDESLNKLTAIQETWLKVYQQQQAQQPPLANTLAPPRPPRHQEWQDPETRLWWCSEDDWQTWWEC